MATWYYTNEKGERVSVSGGQLKGLAKAGLITPETIVENEQGKSAPAGKVRGLTFITPESIPSETAPSEPEIYGVAQSVKPSAEPSPFTASVSERVNPFTATLPVAAKPAESPFTASMPTVSRTMPQPQGIPVPTAEDEEYRKPFNPLPVFVGLGAVILLVLIGFGVAYFGGGGSSGGGGGRVNPNAIALAQLKQAATAERDFIDALKRGSASDMKEAAMTFDLGIVSGSNVSGYSPEFLAVHKEHYTAMVGAEFARTRSGNSDIEREYSKQLVQKYIDSANRYTQALERETARLKSGGSVSGSSSPTEQPASGTVAQSTPTTKQLAGGVQFTAEEQKQFSAAEQAEIERYCAMFRSDGDVICLIPLLKQFVRLGIRATRGKTLGREQETG